MLFCATKDGVEDRLWQVKILSQLNALPLLHELSFIKGNLQSWRKVEGVWQLYDPVSGTTTFYRFTEGVA